MKKWFKDDLTEEEIKDMGMYNPGELFSSSYLVYRDLLLAKIKYNHPVLKYFSISFPDNQRLVTAKNGIFIGDDQTRVISENTETTEHESRVFATVSSSANNPFICKLQIDMGTRAVIDIVQNNFNYGTPKIVSTQYVHVVRGTSTTSKLYRSNVRMRQTTFSFSEFSNNSSDNLFEDTLDKLWEDKYYGKEKEESG